MEKKFMVGTLKVVVAVPEEWNQLNASVFIRDLLERRRTAPGSHGPYVPHVFDWGFVPTTEGRAFFRPVEPPEDLLELREQVDADDAGPEPELEIGQAEQLERRKDYEQLFDQI